MASSNPYRTGNTTATVFTGLTRPITIQDDTPGSVVYAIPGNSAYRSRKTVELQPEGRTGPYGPNDKMRIIFPAGEMSGFADLQGTGKLHFDLAVQSDQTYPGMGNTLARIKISGQSLIQRVVLYQQSNNNLEDFRYYNRVMAYLGKISCASPSSIHSETAIMEYDITEIVGATVTTIDDPLSTGAQVVSTLGGNSTASANNWSNAQTVRLALQINCGFLSEPVLQPFEFYGSPLVMEITWATYQEAFLDTALSNAQQQYAADYMPGKDNQLIPQIPNNITSSPALAATIDGLAAAANLAQSPYSSVCSGNYRVTDVSYRYTEVDVDETLKSRIYARIKSADGLYMHYESFLFDSKQWTGNTPVLDYADACKSLKAIYFMSYPSGADSDSWTMPWPEFPGFVSAQVAVNTEFWPKRPMVHWKEVFEEYQKALGTNNSRLSARLIGRPSSWEGTTIPVYKPGFSISPYHNAALHNILPFTFGFNNAPTSGSVGPTQIVSGGSGTNNYYVAPPVGWDWGIGTLASGTATISSTAVTVTREGSLELGSTIFVSVKSASSAVAPLTSQGALDVNTVVAGTGFHVDSTDAADARQFYWVVMPRPAAQKRTLMIAGLATPATRAISITPIQNRVTLFQQYTTPTPNVNLIVADPANSTTTPVVDLLTPGATAATPLMYASVTENYTPGSGPIIFNIDIPANQFSLAPGSVALVATVPLPPGLPITAATAAIVRPVASSALNGASGAWSNSYEIFVDSSAQTLTLRVPTWAILQPSQGVTTWSVLLADVAYFSNGGAPTTAITAYRNFLTVCQAQPGPYPMEFGVSELVPYGCVTAKLVNGKTTYIGFTPTGGAATNAWIKRHMPIAMLMEAESNPNTISGINLNPNKHVYLYLNRTTDAAQAYSFYNPLNNGTTNYNDPYWNGNPIANNGGYPQMTTTAFFLHDRGVTLQEGMFGNVIY